MDLVLVLLEFYRGDLMLILILVKMMMVRVLYFGGGCKEFVTSTRGTLIEVFEDEDCCDLFGVVFVLIVFWGEVADQIELCGECIGCTRKLSCTKLMSCLC